MFDAAATKSRLEEATEYFLRIDPALSARMAEALTALTNATCPQDFVWTETFTPEKQYFRLTLWRGKTPIEVASLVPDSYHWVQYCGKGWNLNMVIPSQRQVYLGQLGGFKESCEYLRARAKKEWGCPLSEEEEALLAKTSPTKPWA